MADPVTFTAVYEEVDGGWIQGHLAEMPGVITAAPARAEARGMIRDGLGEYLASYRRDPAAEPPGTDTERVKLTIAT
jgi:predicted RNase H-like HicB family nuclease